MARTLRNLDESVALIRKREEFTSRLRKTPYGDFVSMSAKIGQRGFHRSIHGFLPNEYVESYEHAAYAVYSYDTPMAWWLTRPAPGAPNEQVEAWLEGGQVGFWVMPSVSYSNTTANHQSLIAMAIDPWNDERVFTTEYRQLGWNFKHKYKNRGENADGPSVERYGY